VLATGVGFFISIVLISRTKSLGIFSFFFFFITGVIAILGMLQVGPLRSILYKPSVTVRGYYWDAALEMFKSNPFVGIGLDRYGQYFKLFRDVGYPLNYGFDITSSNAHSIPLQLLSTGGFFVGAAYVLLMLFIAFIGVKSLIRLEGQERLLLAGIMAAWLGFQAQSLISIENIGLGIWNWVFSGAIVAMFKLTQSNDADKNAQIEKPLTSSVSLKIYQPLVSGSLTLVFILVASLLYTGDSQTMKSRSYYNQSSQSQSQEFYDFAEMALSNRFNDPYYKLIVVEMLVQSDRYQSGMSYLNKFHNDDPRNLDYLRPLSIIAEKNNDLEGAINYRKQIAKVDPWNLDNYLRLGYLYKSLGDLIQMQEMKEKIISIAPDHIIAETARTQLIL
jgi:tetratricopeptide (TPR) repeat protein